MLPFFILLYLCVSIAIGLYASRRVKSREDFMLAGRSLPLSMATFTVFATWFGSETLLGASATFADEGLLGVIEDPFGATLCLILVGLFFARYFYRLNLLTLSDFYREKFGKKTEIVSAVCMAVSFFGWIAGQLIALGVILHTVWGLSMLQGILISTAIVTVYTLAGGMWSVAMTDFVQTICIIAGIIMVAWFVTPTDYNWQSIALPEHFFDFTPKEKSLNSWLNYLCAWITLGLGSIPSQDIFQRVMSSKNEKVAVRSSVIAGLMYLVIGMIPLYLAFVAKYVWQIPAQDSQALVTTLVMSKTPVFIQILFFGALMSAVLSTASGAMLAPASVISNNLLKPLLAIRSEQRLLVMERLSVFFVGTVSMLLAISSNDIYELVGESSAIGLVSLFVPMLFGIYGKRHYAEAALLSMITGLLSYLFCEHFMHTEFPALLIGLGCSLGSYCVVHWIMHVINKNSPSKSKAI
ncbi:MAG: sodium:solute symporter family protein [Chitinophagales bacterium]|nr:sodium:solute symporter family protein [Chitinophagales bacterium]